MTENNLTQSTLKGQFSRRDFLAALPGFGLLAGASLVATRAARAVLTPEKNSFHDETNFETVDYPDAARSAVIATWERKLDRVMVSLESLWGFLHEARTMAPAAVDGAQFLGLELAAFEQIGQLSADMETNEFEQLTQALTGRKAIYWCLAEQIESGGGSAVDLAQEIEYLSQDEPALAAELLVMLQGAR